ncbi:hypothetical protein ABPG77_006477 [Micractinium sp. CCAP 211/92]
MSADSQGRADELKQQGNTAFKEKHYALAQQFYTKALDEDPANPQLWANRAFAAIRLEEFGSAIADASKALELDPKYAKAFYRRGDASYALGHFKDAVRDFRSAIRLAPSDPDLRRKGGDWPGSKTGALGGPPLLVRRPSAANERTPAVGPR